MLIKKFDDAIPGLDPLETLARGGPPAGQRAAAAAGQVLKAEARAQADIAYLIDFAFAGAEDMAVIHDLHLDEHGRAATIDHLLIHASLRVFVLATRASPFGVQVTDQGEFRRWNPHARAYEDIPSPLAANDRHIAVLRDILAPLLPLRLDGTDWQPAWHSLVVLPAQARIDRPPHFDTRRVIKADLLLDAVAVALRDAGPGLTSDQTGQLARRLAGWHRPRKLPRNAATQGHGRAASDDSAQWRLEPPPEPRSGQRFGWPLLGLALALASALWAGSEFLRGSGDLPTSVPPSLPEPAARSAPAEPAPLPEDRPRKTPAKRTRPLPSELPPKLPRRLPLDPPPPESRVLTPALPEASSPPESAPQPAAPAAETTGSTLEPGASPAPAASPGSEPALPATTPPLERPEVEVSNRSLRARVGDGRGLAEIHGDLPRIREQMRHSNLGIEPANPGTPAAPECRPGGVMTDAEIEACRHQARKQP